MNHDRENMDHPSVLAPSECKTLQQENHAYTKMITTMRTWAITKASRQSCSLVNQNHMSDSLVHERYEAEHENKNEVENQ
jgi:hypothetical protein